jgi:4-hydroxybutyrate dehydrogenase
MPDRQPGFVQPTALDVGPGAVQRLAAHAERLGMRRMVLLIDAALADGDVGNAVKAQIPGASILTTPPGEPTFVSIEGVAKQLASHQANGIVAVGGGSTMDSGKLSRALLASGAASIKALPARIPGGNVGLVLMPTTAGTGAEVGGGSLVFDPAVNDKILVRRPGMAADLALADGDLTLGLPASLTAYTGLDALAQAILAYVPATSDSLSGPIALAAINLILRHLPTAVAKGRDRDARAGMMQGSVLSALAMFNAPPLYAAEHIFAEPIGAVIKVHHGHMVAAFLPGTAEFNEPVLRARYAEIARATGTVAASASEAAASAAWVERLRRVVADLAVPALKTVVKTWDADALLAQCKRNEGYATNPRPMSDADARAIMASAYEGSFHL